MLNLLNNVNIKTGEILLSPSQRAFMENFKEQIKGIPMKDYGSILNAWNTLSIKSKRWLEAFLDSEMMSSMADGVRHLYDDPALQTPLTQECFVELEAFCKVTDHALVRSKAWTFNFSVLESGVERCFCKGGLGALANMLYGDKAETTLMPFFPIWGAGDVNLTKMPTIGGIWYTDIRICVPSRGNRKGFEIKEQVAIATDAMIFSDWFKVKNLNQSCSIERFDKKGLELHLENEYSKIFKCNDIIVSFTGGVFEMWKDEDSDDIAFGAEHMNNLTVKSDRITFISKHPELSPTNVVDIEIRAKKALAYLFDNLNSYYSDDGSIVEDAYSAKF